MDHGRVARMHPTAAQRVGGSFRIAVVATHDDIAPYDDLSQRLAIVWNFIAAAIDDEELTGCDHLDALPCFHGCTLFQR